MVSRDAHLPLHVLRILALVFRVHGEVGVYVRRMFSNPGDETFPNPLVKNLFLIRIPFRVNTGTHSSTSARRRRPWISPEIPSAAMRYVSAVARALRGAPSARLLSTSAPPPITSPRAAAAAIGFGAGALGASAGVGGAVFVIPGLMRFGGLSQRVAAGSSLVAVTFISTTSAATYASAGAVDWPTATILTAAAAVAAPAGAAMSGRVKRDMLRKSLGVMCLTVAPLMPARGWLLERRRGAEADEADGLQAAAGEKDELPPVASSTTDERAAVSWQESLSHSVAHLSALKATMLTAAGSGIGFSAGLLGIGGGNFFSAVTAVSIDAPLRTVLGTSLTAMVLPSMVASAAYLRMGKVHLRLVPPLVLGSVAGAATGSKLALLAPESVLQWGFFVMFGLLGMRLYRAPVKVRMPKNGSRPK